MPQFPIFRNHAPWHKTLIIPIWILQLVFLIAVFALALASLVQNGNYHNYLYGNAASYAESNSGAETILGIDTGFSATSIVLTLVEAFKLANRSLSPALFLLSNLVKFALFVVLAGLDGDGIHKGYDRHRAGGIASFVLDIIAILTILLGLIYAAIILIKTRRVDLASNYGAVTQDPDKPNPIYSTNPVPMMDAVPNTIVEPDIAYHSLASNQRHDTLSGYESYRQTTGIATPAPRYQSYYSTDAITSPPAQIHELGQFGNETRVFSARR